MPRFALAMAGLVLRYRRLFVVVGTLLFSAIVVPKLVVRRSYTAEASFVAQDRQQAGGGALASLAAQFGVAIPTGSSAESPAFYAALVTTRKILSEVVTTHYPVQVKDVNGGTLVQLWKSPGSTPEEQVDATVRALRKSMSVNTSRETGTITVGVRSTNPQLAALVVQRILDLVNDFNVNRRKSQAGEERRFVAARLDSSRLELARAEAELAGFLSRNRQIPPHLQFESDRLQREVTLRQQLHASLAQAFEQARINEARDIAVITIIEPPVVPVLPNTRRIVVTTLRVMVAALALGMILGLILDFLRTSRARGDEELLELTALWRETLADVRNPLRLLRRPSLPRAT